MLISELKKELQFNKDLLSLIDTLKNIAGAKYHEMEKKKERFDEFMEAFVGFFKVINLVEVENPLVTIASDVVGIMVLTSDSGFMGGLNQGVIRAALKAADDVSPDKVSWIIVGDKGSSTFSDSGRKFKFFQGIAEDTIYEQAVEIKDYLVEEILAKRMGKVVVAYARPLSFTAQEVACTNILPCSELFERVTHAVGDGKSAANKFISDSSKVIVESSFVDMVSYLAGVWVTSKLSLVFEDSKLAEFSARAMHLEGSHQKISETHGKLKHKVFKATHELIDKGMRECHAAKQIKEKKIVKKKKKVRQEKAAFIRDEAEAAALAALGENGMG